MHFFPYAINISQNFYCNNNPNIKVHFEYPDHALNEPEKKVEWQNLIKAAD